MSRSTRSLVRDTTAAGLASIGAAGASALAPTAKAKKKKKKTRRGALRNLGNIGMTNGIMSHSTAPTGSAMVARRSAFSNYATRIPVDCIMCYVNTSASGIPYLVASPVTTGASGGWDLHPIANFQATQNAIGSFGPAVRTLAAAFAKWRPVGPLQFTYIGAVNSSTSGSLSIGYSSEPFVSNAPTYNNVAGLNTHLEAPCFAVAPFPSFVAPINHSVNWLSTVTSSNVAAEQRQDFPGSILIAGLGLPVSTFLGTIRVRGTLEFTDLFDESTLLLRTFTTSALATELDRRMDDPNAAPATITPTTPLFPSSSSITARQHFLGAH